MNFSVGSSACHIVVSQIQKSNELDAELTFDRRGLPERKASRIVLEKRISLNDKNQWNAQFDWIIDAMLKLKRALKKYL